MLHWHNKRQQKNTFEDVIKEWFIEAFFNTTAKRKLAANISYIFVYIKVFCKQKNKNWYDTIQYGTIQICANIWFAFSRAYYYKTFKKDSNLIFRLYISKILTLISTCLNFYFLLTRTSGNSFFEVRFLFRKNSEILFINWTKIKLFETYIQPVM